MAAKVKVMGISGSYGNDSNNTKLVKLGLEILSNLGAETHFWDLNENLSACRGRRLLGK